MGSLIAATVLALSGLVAFALWRGRMVSIALAASECPDCRVPLVPVRPSPERAGSERDEPWEICACPSCDRVVTTVGSMPSPVAECPACRQQSLMVYAERSEEGIVVDEWCDLCARRARTVIRYPPPGAPPRDTPSQTPPRMGRVLPFRKEG